MKKFTDENYQEKGIRQSVKDFAEDAEIIDVVELYYNHYRIRRAPTINRDEAIYIVAKAFSESREEWKHWRDLRWALYDCSNILGIFSNQWKVTTYTATSMMDTWDVLKAVKSQCESLINAIPSREEREKAIAKCHDDLSSINGGLYGASIVEKVDDDMYITIDIEGYKRWITTFIKSANSDLSMAKACVTAMEWAYKKFKCGKLADDFLREEIAGVKRDGARSHPEWSKKEMDKRIAKGEVITEQEKAIAIFPYYEDVPKDMKLYENMKGNFEMYLGMRQMEEGNDE